MLIAIVVLYGLYVLYNRLNSQGSFGRELMSQTRPLAYGNGGQGSSSSSSSGPQPAQESGNEVFSSVGGGGSSAVAPSPSCGGKQSNQNPADLLPKDTNSQWAQLHPVGNGDLGQINLLKAGYHMGIDTVGQTLRNASLQIRSEPQNPQLNVGPWNQSTIEPEFMRVPFEIGQGIQ